MRSVPIRSASKLSAIRKLLNFDPGTSIPTANSGYLLNALMVERNFRPDLPPVPLKPLYATLHESHGRCLRSYLRLSEIGLLYVRAAMEDFVSTCQLCRHRRREKFTRRIRDFAKLDLNFLRIQGRGTALEQQLLVRGQLNDGTTLGLRVWI